MERFLVLFFSIFCFLLSLSRCVQNKKNKYSFPRELSVSTNVEIKGQINNKYYIITYYFDYSDLNKYDSPFLLLIKNKESNHYAISECDTSYPIKFLFRDIDGDKKLDVLADIYIGGTGRNAIRADRFLIYSTRYKKIFYQDIIYTKKIVFKEHSTNINKDKRIYNILHNYKYYFLIVGNSTNEIKY